MLQLLIFHQCIHERRQIIVFMLDRGAIVNVEDLRRRTPLHVACENGHLAIVHFLLEQGANINVQDCYTGAELCFLIRGKDKGEAMEKI